MTAEQDCQHLPTTHHRSGSSSATPDAAYPIPAHTTYHSELANV